LETIDSGKVYERVSQLPDFPVDVKEYLRENTHYPPHARDSNIQGRVILKFIVNEDGRMTNINVARGIGGGCDEEAVRIVKEMPPLDTGKTKWKECKGKCDVAGDIQCTIARFIRAIKQSRWYI
jgi:protein TonB